MEIVVVSAGVGVYDVDFKMRQITKQRVLSSGVGVTLINVTEPPFHRTPLFRLQSTSLACTASLALSVDVHVELIPEQERHGIPLSALDFADVWLLTASCWLSALLSLVFRFYTKENTLIHTYRGIPEMKVMPRHMAAFKVCAILILQ